MIFNLFVDPHLGMGHFFSLFVFADHILATCHILNGHKESTSLFGAAKGKVAKKATVGKQDRKGGRKGNCRRSVEEKGGCSRDHWEGKSKKDKGDTEKNEKRRERRVELERTGGGKGFLSGLLERKDSCPISGAPSWRELF